MGSRRRTPRVTQEAKELKEEEVKEDCKICGASYGEQEVSEGGSQASIGRQFSYFQTTTRKSLELSECVLNKVKHQEAALATQQTDVNRMQQEMEAERLRLASQQKTQEQKEKSLEALYSEYTTDQQTREQLLIQREHTVENMMTSLNNKEEHIKGLQKELESRMQTLKGRELNYEESWERREHIVAAKEEKIQDMEKDHLEKQKNLTDYSHRITTREHTVLEKEEALAKEMKEREDALQMREKDAQVLLESADKQKREIADLESALLKREKKFSEGEKAAIKELEVREVGLNKREIDVGDAQEEVRKKADVLEDLKEEFKKRVEQFDQWERLSKYDLTKREETVTSKETELNQRIEAFDSKERDVSVQINDFQTRESEFKLHKETVLREIERNESTLTERETLLKKSEEIVTEREKEVHSKLRDIKQREETFKKEYSVWKIDIERRERIVQTKEESIERMTESSAEQHAALKAAEKEIENKRLLFTKEEAETKKKLKSERLRMEELSIGLKELETRTVNKEKELGDWEQDLAKRDRLVTQKGSEVELDLKRREKEVFALESKWRKAEEECARNYKLLADREEDLIQREDMFLKNENAHSKDLTQRSRLVQDMEAKLIEKEHNLSHREMKVEERESYVSKKITEINERETTVFERIEIRERKVSSEELEHQKKDKHLKDKEESLDLLSEDLLQREKEFNVKKNLDTQDVERRLKDIREKEMDLSRRLRELQEHEGDISKVRKELGSRLEEIQHRESMVSGIVEREKRLEERERAVGVKNADVLRRQGDVSGREKDVVAMRERFTSQMRDLEIRERKIVSEEERLAIEIEKRESAVHKLELEVKTSRGSFSARESSLSAREEEVTKREKWLLSMRSGIDDREADFNSRDAKLRNAEETLKEKENNLKLYEKDIVARENDYLKRERLMRSDLEKREQVVENAERSLSSREVEIRSLHRQVHSEKESIEFQRTEMLSLREKMEQRELRIKDLDLQIKKREIHIREAQQLLKDYEGDLVRRARYICQRRVSDGIIEGADPPLDLHPSDPLTDFTFTTSEHTRAPVKKETVEKVQGSTVIERVTAPIDLTPVRVRSRAVGDVTEEGDTEVRGWYGRMRNILFGWKTASPRHIHRDDLERAGHEMQRIGNELEQRELFVRARESEINKRLEEEGYPASGSRKRSSMGTGTDDALADTPLTNATVPLHQLASGHDSEKASGRWRRTSGGGLRVLRSSVDGAEGEAGLEGTRVISMDEASGDWDDWSKRLRKTHKVQTTTYTRSTRTNTVIEGRQTETKAGDVQTKPPSEEGMVEDSDNQ